MKKKKIHFVSTNNDKIQNYKSRLENEGFDVKIINLEIPESRDLQPVDVANKKLEYVCKKTKKRPIFVEDRGVEIENLNGFPGSFVKVISNLLTWKTLSKFVKTGDEIKIVYAITLLDEDGKTVNFSGEERGLIKTNPNQNINNLKDIFCHYKFPHKTLNELDDIELAEYNKLWIQDDALFSMINYLKK